MSLRDLVEERYPWWLDEFEKEVHDFVKDDLAASLGKDSLALLVGDLMHSMGASRVIVTDKTPVDGEERKPSSVEAVLDGMEIPEEPGAQDGDSGSFADVVAMFSECHAVACIKVYGQGLPIGAPDVADAITGSKAMRSMSRTDYGIHPWIITSGTFTKKALRTSARKSVATTDGEGLASLVIRYLLGSK